MPASYGSGLPRTASGCAAGAISATGDICCGAATTGLACGTATAICPVDES